MPRVLIVSNRLPVSICPDRPAPNDVEQSSGGLASALRSVVDDFEEVLWIGWPGNYVADEAEEKRMEARLREESTTMTLIPVWLTQTDVEDFDSGFSNSTLWPLLHWMTPYARFKKAWADSYRRVNELYAEVVLRVCRPGDMVWVHDYHLFLLPRLLRNGSERFVQQDIPRNVPRPKDLPPPLASSMKGESAESENVSELRPDHLPDPLDGDVQAAVKDTLSNDFRNCDSLDAAVHTHTRFQSIDCGTGLKDAVEDEPRPDVPKSIIATSTEASRPTSPKGVRFNVHDPSPKAGEGCEDKPSFLQIAFFLHTPFPASEIISMLPNCPEIVEGMLGANLIGFHTYSYLRHYRSCLIRLVGVTPAIDYVDHHGFRTKLGVFPIGANWRGIREAMRSERFAEHLRTYTQQFQGKSLVLSVERLDYSKGMPQKLAAIERYLEEVERVTMEESDLAAYDRASQEDQEVAAKERADRLRELQKRFGKMAGREGFSLGSSMRVTFNNWMDKVISSKGNAVDSVDHARTVFLFIAIPSRREVPEYQSIEEEVHRRVSTINGRFSTVDHQPIVYIHRGVSPDELAALYARADVCLVTPLIDGMNLVAKEFVAAKDRTVENVVPGTIVLSEFAGAAQELFDALIVNPYDEDRVADAIHMGLELVNGSGSEEDLGWACTDRMRKDVLHNDAQHWARNLLQELQRACDAPEPRSFASKATTLPDFTANFFFETAPGTKALFLDFDGILKDLDPIQRTPKAFATEDVDQVFHCLASRSDLKVFIVSGMKTDFLDRLFGTYGFTLIAENGYLVRPPGDDWQTFSPRISTDWMDKVRRIMEMFARCTPGARIDTKAFSLVWHYADCEEEHGEFKAKELSQVLASSLGNLPCHAHHGDKFVEVASLDVRKGMAVRTLCLVQQRTGGAFSEIVCIGDDDVDESMFFYAPTGAYTVKVGSESTHACHHFIDFSQVCRFMRLIADQPTKSVAMTFTDTLAFKSIEVVSNVESPEGETDPLAWLQEQEQ